MELRILQVMGFWGKWVNRANGGRSRMRVALRVQRIIAVQADENRECGCDDGWAGCRWEANKDRFDRQISCVLDLMCLRVFVDVPRTGIRVV